MLNIYDAVATAFKQFHLDQSSFLILIISDSPQLSDVLLTLFGPGLLPILYSLTRVSSDIRSHPTASFMQGGGTRTRRDSYMNL